MKESELGKRVREVAGTLRARLAATARELGRRAQDRAGRVLRDVGERLGPGPGPARGACSNAGCPRAPRPGGDSASQSTGGANAGCPHVANLTPCEPNLALGPRTLALSELMVEVLERSGYREIKVDLEGHEPPALVRGTVRSHRPSLMALGGGRPVLFDVFVPGDVAYEEQLSRWQLFASAAEQISGEFHVVVPGELEGVPGREWVRRLAEGVGMTVTKVWEV